MAVSQLPRRPREVRKRSLSPARQRLIEAVQTIGWGWIDDLRFHDGEPLFDELLGVQMRIRTDRPVAPSSTSVDFLLKRHHLDLLDLLDRHRSGRIVRLLVQDGLPMHLNETTVKPA